MPIISSSGSTPRHVGQQNVGLPQRAHQCSVGGGEAESRVIEEAKAALVDGKPASYSTVLSTLPKRDVGICGGQVECFVEPILPRVTLLVVGGGHVWKAVLHLGPMAGLSNVVSDDRPEFCTPESKPQMR